MTLSDEETRALVCVAQQHGTTVAATWAGVSTWTIQKIRKAHDPTFTRGRGHPTREEMQRAKPRRWCPCERCTSHYATEAIRERQAFSQRRTIVATDRPTWVDDANCRGMDADIFFPGRGASLTKIREVCAGCAVREQCLDFAIDSGEKFGVWGGMSERERRRVRHQRRRQCQEQVAS